MQLQGDTQATQQTQGLDSLPRGVPAGVAGLLQGGDGGVIAKGFPTAAPLAVRVGQATFALRRHEAAQVLVHVPRGAA